ncbi:hypothetical protein [Cloacibacterium normanense]|uniref:hypothetical protein n=1 Tax=Cloacibacterium normanense TaxID=237258 RepID=UPI00391CA49F
MDKLNIGDLVSLKSHPFNIFNESLIGAFVDNTPPIMVISEVLKSNSYDTESEEIDTETKKAKKLPNQYLCYFYSSKNSSFEKYWFKQNEIKKIDSDTETNQGKVTKTEDKASLLNKYKDNLIVLKSADLELGKKKTTWSRTKEEDINKTQAFLEFLSPVMTVIDVVENQNFNKDRVNPKNGEIKRESCKFLLKCKWFNPIKQTFSEEIIPYKILQLVEFNSNKIESIENGINTKNVFQLIEKDLNISLENSRYSFNKYIIELKEVVIQNHLMKIFYKNLINNKIESKIIENLEIIDSEKEFKQFVDSEFPNYSNSEYNNPLKLEWQKDKFYKIDYLDKKGKFTTRIITNCKVEEFETEDDEKDVKFVIANCLLRDGKIRHFRLSNITARAELKDDFKDIIGYGIKPNDK